MKVYLARESGGLRRCGDPPCLRPSGELATEIGVGAVLVHVLGPFEITREGKSITPSAPKLRRVLALLSVHAGGTVRLNQLMEELWEDRPPQSATTTMHTYIYHLRKALRSHPPLSGEADDDAAGPLRTVPGGYVLDLPPDAVDVRRFERLAAQGHARLDSGDLAGAAQSLREALGLWRGPALSAVRCGPVLKAEAVRLEELRKAAVEQSLDANLRLGRHQELISELTGLVGEHPTHEGFQAKLMLALYRSGRRSEALQAYQRAREVLADELGLEPSTELRRMHRAVLAADAALDAPVTEAVTVRAEAPCQLPPDSPRLVGRDSELEQVVAALSGPGSSPVVIASGAPGSGKSAFCTRAAHQVREAFPDGQLYARLVDAEGARVAPGDVLGDFLLVAGVPADRIPASPRERVWAYRAYTSDRRLLVLLDDAVDAEQILPLLPTGTGCATLVAARRRLSHSVITHQVYLPRLTQAEALRLITDVLGGQRLAVDLASVHQLLALCDGLPAALRGVADWLSTHPHWPVARSLSVMRDGPRLAVRGAHESPLTGTELTYALLPPGDQRAFRVVATTASGPVSPRHAAGALDVDEQTAEAALERLVECQLAEIDTTLSPAGHGGFRYWFRPLVRATAQRLHTRDGAGQPAPAGLGGS